MLQIRKIKPEDIEFVLGLVSDNGYPTGRLLTNIENFLICESDNVKCGCGCIVLSGDKGFIGWVAVSESQRRKKLGSAITKALLNIADLKGVKEVYAADICIDFMKAMGFEKQENKTPMSGLKEVFGDTNASECCKVFLEGYFKPCSHR